MKKPLLFLFASLMSWGAWAQINDYVPEDGLVLYLPFNNSFTDLSPTNALVNSFGGTISPDQFGNNNSAYTCTQEQNLEINTADYSELQPDGDFSIALWVHYTGVTLGYDNIHYPTFVECGEEYFLRYHEYPQQNMKVNGGYLNNASNYTGTEYLIKNRFVPYPGWTHVVYTVKTNGSQSLYVNGDLQSSMPGTGPINHALNSILKIGGNRSTNLNEKKRFAGSFDDIAIYNRELSSTEVQQLRNGYLDKYRGKGTYLTFNGATYNGNYVEIATPLNLNSNSVIIEAMVYFESGAGADAFDGIVVSRGGNTVAGIIINAALPNGVRVGYMWNGLHYDWTGGPTVTYNEWHSIRLVITPQNAMLFANGTITTNQVAHAAEEFDGKLLLGYDGYGDRYFKGRIDEVRIWKNPTMDDLNHAFVGNRHNCPFRAEYYPSLVAQYDFNVGADIANNVIPRVLPDVLGLRNGTLMQYSAANPWGYGGPVVNIDIEVTTDPLTPGVLTAAEKNASGYQWFKVGEVFPEYQDGATNRSFSATSDGNYFVRLTKNSCVLNSDSVLFATTITALDNQAHLSDIQFYPNPSRGLVTLTRDVDGVKVYSTQGKLLLQATGKEIDLRSLSKGSYILKIENQQETSTHKLILE